MKEYRCKKDQKLLLKACLLAADIEIKCKSCGTVNHFIGEEEDLKYMCYKYPCQNRVEKPQDNSSTESL